MYDYTPHSSSYRALLAYMPAYNCHHQAIPFCLIAIEFIQRVVRRHVLIIGAYDVTTQA